MAAKNLIKRKSVERDRGLRNDKGQQQPQKCPIFNVQYLGKMPARGEYGREYIAEPVEALIKLKERQKLPKSALQITEKGFHFLDFNGPFGKEKHVLIPIHHICYGVADEMNPRVFAIITRTDSNPENSLFECHAFLCERKKNANEVTYWLLRTFLEVFEDLQRRRRMRQDRKIRRQQSAMIGTPGANFDVLQSPPNSPTDSLGNADMTMYSVILDGSKNKGAAVRLAMNRGNPRPVSFPPGNNKLETAKATPHSARDMYNGGAPGRAYPPAGHIVKAETQADVHGRPLHSDYQFARHYDPPPERNSKDIPAYQQRTAPIQGTIGEPHQPAEKYRDNIGARYSKNPALGRRSRSSTGATSSTDESISTLFSDSFSGVSHDDSEYIFIQMLQEEFGGLDISDAGGAGGGRSSASTKGTGPPDQKLRSEDIEKRVREWLTYEEGDTTRLPPVSPVPGSPASTRSPTGYNPGYTYHNGYYGGGRGRSSHRPISQSSVASDGDYF